MPDNLHFRISSIIQETADAKTYELEEINHTRFAFRPGQFLTFLLTIGNQEFRRSFSILSLPGEPLLVTVKKVENGVVSRYILMHWKEGDTIKSLQPAGRFTVSPDSAVQRDIFFIAAGSGITPVLPQIRHLLKNEPGSIIYLYYSNHSESDTLFREALNDLEKKYPALHIRHFVGSPKVHAEARVRLNNGILEDLVRKDLRFNPNNALFMICGPFTFMRMARITLIFMHFDESQIRRENFLPEIMRQGQGTGPDLPDRYITLHWDGETHHLLVKRHQTILRAAKAANIALPYSCEGGVCSTCAAKCNNGKVTMSINEVLTDKELLEGWILTCTGYPADDDVTIYYP